MNSQNKNIDILKQSIRSINDFPQKGIVFKDITPLLASNENFKIAIDELCKLTKGKKIDKVIGIDARGFIFAAAVAYKLNAGFIPIRKFGKLPYNTTKISYILEYGEAEVEMHTDAIQEGENCILIDDLLATGGTAKAGVELIEKLKGNIIFAGFLIELTYLNGRDKLTTVPVKSLITY